MIKKVINNLLDSAISILETNFDYSIKYKDEENNAVPHLNATTLGTCGKVELFQEIYGHESIKTVINMALVSDKPVHVLLTSPPGMAKTQFLLAIKNIFINESCFVIGSNSTKKGKY